MRLILDTADLKDIKYFNDYFPICGVTTNPTILSREGGDIVAHLKKIREIIGKDKELHVQVTETAWDKMIEEAHAIVALLGENTFAKIPATPDGLRATRELAEEGIDHTDAFVALTGLDEANILMAMCASRQTEQCKVVAKINRRSLMDLVSSEGIIDSVVSARDVTTELIVQYVRAMEGAAGSQIKTLHRLVEGAVEALEFHVDRDPDLVNVPLRELKLRSGVLIAGIVRRDGEIVIPGGNDTIRAGDDVIVVTQDTALQELRDILRQG